MRVGCTGAFTVLIVYSIQILKRRKFWFIPILTGTYFMSCTQIHWYLFNIQQACFGDVHTGWSHTVGNKFILWISDKKRDGRWIAWWATFAIHHIITTLSFCQHNELGCMQEIIAFFVSSEYEEHVMINWWLFERVSFQLLSHSWPGVLGGFPTISHMFSNFDTGWYGLFYN